jgi:hypothetical protein
MAGDQISSRTQLQVVGSIAALIAASIALISFVRAIVPDAFKTAATILTGSTIALIIIGYFTISRIRGAILKRSRFLKALAIALVIPISHFFIDHSYFQRMANC